MEILTHFDLDDWESIDESDLPDEAVDGLFEADMVLYAERFGIEALRQRVDAFIQEQGH